MRNFLLLSILSLFIASCTPSVPPEDPIPTTVQELIAQAGEIPAAPTLSDVEIGQITESLEENGEKYRSTSKQRKLNNRFDQIGSFGKYAEVTYPGVIIQGKELQEGKLTPIAAALQPITITLQGGNSTVIENPTYASVNSAVVDLATASKPTAANLIYNKRVMSSTEESFLGLGLDVSWLVGSVRSKFESVRGTTTSSALLYFKQVYFTVSTSKPGFDTAVTVAQLQPFISKGNPPCYISSVDYGRIILVKVTAKKSYEELRTEIGGSYLNVDGEVEFGGQSQNEDYTFDAVIIGGSAAGAAQALTMESLEAVNNLIRKEATYSPSNPGVPISYTVRHLASQSPVLLGASTVYTIPQWEMDPTVKRKFDVSFQSIEVIEDCDYGTAGKGDFYYEFVILNDRDDIIAGPISRAWNEYDEADVGGSVEINKTLSFEIPKVHASSFRIEGYVRDNDSDSDRDDYQEMGHVNTSFVYPWTGPDYNQQREIPLEGGSSCRGRLRLQINVR